MTYEEYNGLCTQAYRHGVDIRQMDAAQNLLAAMPADARVKFEWIQGFEWQVSVDGTVLHCGTFVMCVVKLAAATTTVITEARDA